MAFGTVTSFDLGQSSTANQSSIVSSSDNFTVGRLYIFTMAMDNNQTTDGDEGAVSGVTDTLGNTWTKAKEFTNGQGAAQAGATISVWYSVCTVGGTGTVTASLTNNTSRDKTAWLIDEVTIGAGSTIAIEATNTLANDGADPGSLNATTSNIECLRWRAIAAESNIATALTNTAGWASSNRNNTSGGGSAANIAVRYEYIISTGTGAASDPTSDNSDSASVYIAFKEVTSAKTLVAAAGSFSINGTAATLIKGHPLPAGAGGFALSGTAATLVKGHPISAGAGSFALSGATAFLLHKWNLAAGTNSYALTGANANLSKGLTLSAVAGSFVLTGTAASLLHTWKVAAGAGSYALTGTNAALNKGLRVTAGGGQFGLTGSAATLLHGWSLPAAVGSYALSGSDATLTKTGIKLLAADSGGFSLTGSAATLKRALAVQAANGSFALSGQPILVSKGWLASAGAGSFALSGAAASLIAARKLTADGGAFLLTGSDADLLLAHPGGSDFPWRMAMRRRHRR